MTNSQIWAGKFTITDSDFDYLTNLLLERETPLSLEDLALALVTKRMGDEAEAVRQKYDNIRVYRPADVYQVGDKLIFPALDYATGVIESVREGCNPEAGAFNVISVSFDDEPGRQREFASGLASAHKLNEIDPSSVVLPGIEESEPSEVFNRNRETILKLLYERLTQSDELVVIAKKWFPRSLILDVNEGYLNLAEAVLDLAGGGPLPTESILEQIGGIGSAPQALQVFSMNYALAHDQRFDEVGPTGQVLWYLTRLEPQEVLQTPPILRYTPINHDPSFLTDEMIALIEELDDELSPLEFNDQTITEATIALIYPHRRMGTLPLNARMRRIFPTALRTPRVWVTLVDGQDGEELTGWVVREERYVYGLGRLFRKHKLPVGAYVTVKVGGDGGKIVVNFASHRTRTEWVKLITPRNNQLAFDEQKRGIGADYDELLLLGTDDIAGVDALAEAARQQRRPLTTLIRIVIAELARFSPQAAVHAKTIYSAVNVLRRCPPDPILATLNSSPDFEHVGNLYWKLSDS